jgi:TRAP-type C4-dicarboxylate transport system permease small subunit
VKLSVAKRAVDSTLRRILNYTAEIIMSIILLIIICIPLVFVIPMWFEAVVLGAPRAELALDPVHWFGFDGASWLTFFLVLVSFGIGYFYILKLKPGVVTEEVEEEIETDEDEEIEEELAEEIVEALEGEPEESVEELTNDSIDEETSDDETEEDYEIDE